jgi:hypothetical protein
MSVTRGKWDSYEETKLAQFLVSRVCDKASGRNCFLQVLFPRFCKLLFAATPQGILRVALH